MILFGIILASIGIMVFLFAVDAFLDSDIKVFMTILNIILILALLGVTICKTSHRILRNSIHLSFSLAHSHCFCSSFSFAVAPPCCFIHSQQCQSPQTKQLAALNSLYYITHFHSLRRVSSPDAVQHTLFQHKALDSFRFADFNFNRLWIKWTVAGFLLSGTIHPISCWWKALSISVLLCWFSTGYL